jgi:hypothetical protein
LSLTDSAQLNTFLVLSLWLGSAWSFLCFEPKAQLGSRSIKLELFGSAKLHQIKVQAKAQHGLEEFCFTLLCHVNSWEIKVMEQYLLEEFEDFQRI